jgi:hypothetical protein
MTKASTLMLAAVSALLPSLATASPWTSLGPLDALNAPALATDLSAVSQAGLNAAVTINVGLVQASCVVETRTFAVTQAALRNFELQQSCPL